VARERANQISIVDEVLAVGFRLGERYSSEREAEFQKMPGQNEGCRRPWPHDSLELKREQRFSLAANLELTKDSTDIILYES